ncbi:HAD family hydrolase [Amycolatopsis magusensis]|uniref:HAD family hydrolase n=1 Tax=Amycolatopsis magusensis TaxID=882444 RepID=UPI0024A7FCEE|nr:haloacid dehalogenase-like hydrolase [Amycolatopsis magusensis]MDI5974813.1 haloacid dehalogenase-like hydrolase [Amycolatopsis magusensis]
MNTPHRLVLWDIDLTLVDLRGLGGRWYTDALLAVTGTPLRELPSFPGRTERAITTEILTAHGIEPTDELIQRMWRELVRLSERGRATLAEFGHALPGAALALSTLAGQGVVQSLVTGNLPEIALHKLAAFDLHDHLDLEIGGYGTLSAHRPDLVAHAIERASEKHGRAFAPEVVAVVGDTPHDVTAALAHGAIAVGVATGRHSAEELADSGAHTVLTDLSDTQAVIRALTAA